MITQEELNIEFETLFGKLTNETKSKTKMGFYAGVEFIKSKMYSEEDVKKAFDEGAIQGFSEGRGGDCRDFEQYFKTIKKK